MAMSEAQANRIIESLNGKAAAGVGGLAVDVAATSTTVGEARPDRALMIINYSDTLVWVETGGTAVAGQGIPLAPRADAENPGGYVLIGRGGLPYTGIVTAIHEGSGTKRLVGTEV